MRAAEVGMSAGLYVFLVLGALVVVGLLLLLAWVLIGIPDPDRVLAAPPFVATAAVPDSCRMLPPAARMQLPAEPFTAGPCRPLPSSRPTSHRRGVGRHRPLGATR